MTLRNIEFDKGGRVIAVVMMICSATWAATACGAESTPAPAGSGGTAAPATQGEPFDVWEFDVEGNTILKTEDVERAVYPFLGPKRGLGAVQQARKALEATYRKHGYPTVLVSIPEQEVKQGLVHLKVTEGRVARVHVTGSRYHLPSTIKKEVPSLAAGEVPYLPAVQKQLGELNKESADRVVTPVLRPGRTPGTLEVELKVKDQLPLHGGLELNGRNSADTTRSRLNGSLRYNNLWQKQHMLALQYQTSPENTSEVQVFSGTYALPLGQEGDRLALYAIRSNSNVSTLGDTSVIGKGTIMGLRWVRPLPGGARTFHTLSLGLDYKHFDDNIVQGADQFDTPIRYWPLSVRYDATVRGDADLTSFGVGATFALRSLGSNQTQFSAKRTNSQSNFFYLRGNVRTTHQLPHGWQLQARLAGQLANSPLISNEEFSAGGADSVRGYYESQALGDDGVSGSVEVYTPKLLTRDWLQGVRVLAFYDAAALRVQQPLPGQISHYSLAGAGFGVRFQAWKHVNGALDWARALKSVGTVKSGDQRVHFRMSYDF